MFKRNLFLAAFMFVSLVAGRVYAVDGKFSFPQVDGMTIEYNYPDYTGEDLWDYINGAADGYLAYHFEILKIAEYKGANGQLIKVEVYQLHRPEDAYGIYSMERSPDYHFIKIGAEGYSEASLVNFVAGSYYVKITSEAGEIVSGPDLLKVAKAVCKSLVEKPSLPKILSVFPPEGKLEHSDVFISTNVLGNEFLQDAFKADYKNEGETFSIIIFKRDNPENCAKILKAYFDYTGEQAPAAWNNGPYVVHDKYNGTINFYLWKDVLFGFMGLKDKALRDKLTGEILKNLDR